MDKALDWDVDDDYDEKKREGMNEIQLIDWVNETSMSTLAFIFLLFSISLEIDIHARHKNNVECNCYVCQVYFLFPASKPCLWRICLQAVIQGWLWCQCRLYFSLSLVFFRCCYFCLSCYFIRFWKTEREALDSQEEGKTSEGRRRWDVRGERKEMSPEVNDSKRKKSWESEKRSRGVKSRVSFLFCQMTKEEVGENESWRMRTEPVSASSKKKKIRDQRKLIERKNWREMSNAPLRKLERKKLLQEAG